MKLNNIYIVLRHGQAISNIEGFVSSWPEKTENPLTEKGRKEAEDAAEKLASESIDLIFSSDVLRAKQTAEILGEKLKIIPKYDERLREIDFGIFSSKPVNEFTDYFKNAEQRIKGRAPGGESYEDVSKRMGAFLKDAEADYKGKNILVVSHQAPLFVFEGIILGFTVEKSVEYFLKDKLLSNCEIRKL